MLLVTAGFKYFLCKADQPNAGNEGWRKAKEGCGRTKSGRSHASENGRETAH